jgi:hypothetical protein
MVRQPRRALPAAPPGAEALYFPAPPSPKPQDLESYQDGLLFREMAMFYRLHPVTGPWLVMLEWQRYLTVGYLFGEPPPAWPHALATFTRPPTVCG